MAAATATEIGVWPQTLEEFSRLIEASQDELVSYAFYRLGCREDAEDVVQDVFVQVFRDREKRRNITGVRPYLFRMTGNRCTDLLRSRSRKSGPPVVETLQQPGDPADAEERIAGLSRLLSRIPDREAEVIRLRTWSELSFAEIAEAVQSSVPTVKSRFRYGVEKLRRLIASQGGLFQ